MTAARGLVTAALVAAAPVAIGCRKESAPVPRPQPAAARDGGVTDVQAALAPADALGASVAVDLLHATHATLAHDALTR